MGFVKKNIIVPPTGLTNQGLRKNSIQNIGFLPGRNGFDKKCSFCELKYVLFVGLFLLFEVSPRVF